MAMYDLNRPVRSPRPMRRGLELNQVLGWGICALAVIYLAAATVVSLLAN